MHEQPYTDRTPTYTGTEWAGGFFATAGLLWVLGALAFGIVVMMGGQRVNVPADAAGSNQTPIANSTETQ